VKYLTFCLFALLCFPGYAPASGKRAHAIQTTKAQSSAGTGDLESTPLQRGNDPLRSFNQTVFAFNDRLTTYLLRPFAHGYVRVVPVRVRSGVSNFFDNLGFPVRFVNCILQGKLSRSAQEVGKFVVNSTAGVGGLIHVSDHVSSLANVPSEDFGQTLGVWGIPPGPYIVIPVLGPSDCRDIVGMAGDYVLYPLDWYPIGITFGIFHHSAIANALTIALSATRTVNDLPKKIDLYDQVKSAAVDPYVAVRDGYLSFRQAQIRK
jgi:phospholipid-binding lipoprotein MlaA